MVSDKKIYVRLLLIMSVLLIIISNTSFSQYNLKELQRRFAECGFSGMPYSSSSGENGISLFEYGEDGRLSRSTWKQLDNSRSSVNIYKYDFNGNIIEKYREFSDGLTSTETFEYDSDNQLLTEKFHRSDGYSNKANYLYNAEGEVIKAEWEGYHGWFTGQISFVYDSTGKLSKGSIIQDKKVIGFINFSYDSEARLIEEYWEFTGNYNQTFTFEYKKAV
ncbi:MAG TPA: hypothetical protein VMV47_18170 [Bacteroidales bacterium]|nr:hypothetical protein [Bacteroidales bacterium]